MSPIILLFHLRKLTERVIANKLRASLQNMVNQSAYTPILGTNDAHVKLTTNIMGGLDNNNNDKTMCTYVGFLQDF